MNNIAPFNSFTYTNKNDGLNYTAELKTINKENGEQIDTVFVHQTDAEPDANGKINGTLMTKDTFMKEFKDSVPTVNTDDSFEKNHYHIQNIGCTIDIDKNDDGTYTVTSKSSSYGAEPETKVISEEEFQAEYAKFI